MTGDMFLCITQNGEMCTVRVSPRFQKKTHGVEHGLVQRQHVDESSTRESLQRSKSTWRKTCKPVKIGQNDIYYINAFSSLECHEVVLSVFGRRLREEDL